MINKIHMKNVASYKNETILQTDKKTNLVYGLNGTGKSTLSNFLYNINDPLYSECQIDGLLNTDRLLVYNQQFIRDNFYETEDIQGIFTLSKENKAVKLIIENANKSVKQLLKQQANIGKDITDLQEKYKKQLGEYQKEVWKIKTQYTGGDRVLEYCLEGLKGKKEALFEYIVSLPKSEDKPTYTIEDLKAEATSLQGDAKKEAPMPSIAFEVEEIENSQLLTKVIVGNKDSSISELIDKLNNSDWINEGLQYIDMKNEPAVCPFCQQHTITNALLKQLEGYFDESYKKDKENLSNLLNKYLSGIQNIIVKLEGLKENTFCKRYQTELEACIEKLNSLKAENSRRLENKIKNPSIVVSLDKTNEIEKRIEELIKKVNSEIREYNQKIDNKRNSLNEIKDKFWNLMRYEYDSVISLYNTIVKDYNKSLGTFKCQLTEIQNDIDSNQEIIRENQKKTVNIDEAVDNIKQGLVDIGITDFTIEKYSDEDALYHLKREENSENVFKTLSEGEKMVISFLYFIELCKGETQAGSTATGKIIVIDDPVSSLSHIYIFNIGRLIHNEFLRTEKYEQIFVLTHSLYFFYELTCTNHEERKKMQNLYRLCKNSAGSVFVPMKYEEIQNDYQAYWHIVKDKNQPPALIANCMRNIMEYFFNFVEKQDFAQVFQRPELQVTRFAAFNRYMNRESHSKGQNIFDIKEFDYDSFREAFKLVFEKEGYSAHYKKMMK